jgi:hypothetical protein
VIRTEALETAMKNVHRSARLLACAATFVLLSASPSPAQVPTTSAAKPVALVELDFSAAQHQITVFSNRIKDIDPNDAKAAAETRELLLLLDQAEELIKPYLKDARMSTTAWVQYASILSLRRAYGKAVDVDDAAFTLAVLQVLLDQGRLLDGEHIRKSMIRLNAIPGVASKSTDRLKTVQTFAINVTKATAGDSKAALRVGEMYFMVPGPMRSTDLARQWLLGSTASDLISASNWATYGPAWSRLTLECARDLGDLRADLVLAAQAHLLGQTPSEAGLHAFLTSIEKVKHGAKKSALTPEFQEYHARLVDAVRKDLATLQAARTARERNEEEARRAQRAKAQQDRITAVVSPTSNAAQPASDDTDALMPGLREVYEQMQRDGRLGQSR